ncbi:MAG: 3TM-type holin [Pseudomonadota bacterium]
MITQILDLLDGPVFKIIDKLIPDPDLKLKLKAEIQTAVREAQAELVNAQRDVVLAEYELDSWITRHWRPCLMFLAMFILALYGIILPFGNLLLDAPIGFAPLWDEVPAGVWELLKWGVGGYVGGRSLEKIAGAVVQTTEKGEKPDGFRRRFIRKRIM